MMKKQSLRWFALLTGGAVSAVLSGCYVVPMNQTSGAVNATQPAVVTPVPRPVYTARLYPTNDTAAGMGRIAGTISNPERGHGEFSFTVNGESFSGEATRPDGVNKGTANATGNRGTYAKCTYTMSRAALGTGTCVFSNGAVFDLHISL